MNILISIIVPIFKVEPYLCRCIDSLLEQDYHCIEIILVDDGSPDRCGEICEAYSRKDVRIKVIHQKNGGLSSARNTGIRKATGKYLMFVDSDDYVEKNFCSYALSKLLETHSDIVTFGYNDVCPDRIERQSVGLYGERMYSKEEALLELNGGKILSFAWNKIYRASLFANIRYPEGRVFEDIGTTYLLFDKANCVYVASGVTYNYQKRNDSILGKQMTAKDATDWFLMLKERYDFLSDKYPKIALQTVSFVAETSMFCLTNLMNFKGYVVEKKTIMSFLLTLKPKVKKYVSNHNLSLFYFSPLLFRFVRSLKNIFK